ncbi:MAG: hypothetical protein KGL54_10800, partial [Sphingomonadales bacterium]|nr:hypothetical protein [Sphingomonadales bacterium]
MSLKSTAGSVASPYRAAKHFGGALDRRPGRGNQVPAMVWLWFGLVVLAQVRRGALTNSYT